MAASDDERGRDEVDQELQSEKSVDTPYDEKNPIEKVKKISQLKMRNRESWVLKIAVWKL